MVGVAHVLLRRREMTESGRVSVRVNRKTHVTLGRYWTTSLVPGSPIISTYARGSLVREITCVTSPVAHVGSMHDHTTE